MGGVRWMVVVVVLGAGVSVSAGGGGAATRPGDGATTRAADDPWRWAALTVELDDTEFVLGENVLVHCRITNDGAEPLKFIYGAGWRRQKDQELRVTVGLVDDKGRVIRGQINRFVGVGGFPCEVKHGDEWWGCVALMRGFDFEEAGEYRVTVSIEVGRSGGAAETGPTTAPADTVTLTAGRKLKMRMPDEKQAARVAQRMAALGQPVRAKVGEQTKPYADFATMRYPVYLPVLKGMAGKGDPRAAEALEGIMTPEAVLALVELSGAKNGEVARQAMWSIVYRLPRMWGVGPVEKGWDESLTKPVAELGWRLVEGEGAESQSAGGAILARVAAAEDLPRLIKALDRVLESKEEGPAEGNTWPTASETLALAMEALWQRAGGSVKPPMRPTTRAERYAFMVWMCRDPASRPAGWEEPVLKLLNDPLARVRAMALEKLWPPLPERLANEIERLLKDPSAWVRELSCRMAGASGSAQYREGLLEVIKSQGDEGSIDAAVEAAIRCGVERDVIYAACAERLDDPAATVAEFAALRGMVDSQNGSTYSPEVIVERGKELKVKWKQFVAENRDAIRAGKKFKIGEPPLTAEMFAPGFRFGREDGTMWP